jgi:hypothetical protein
MGRLTRGSAVNPDGRIARRPSPACPAGAFHAGPATVLMDSTGQDGNGISGKDRSLPRNANGISGKARSLPRM